ncbi:hypothetical protein AA958_07455 [Streptomyces sp. CNQ-509]|uniref:hypothetical protein n=1 Tax=Streptomyces sp. CNQ-509 TaxID=444103 RepID=UPI00062DE8AB|nr:hypothetical protein [Streptomyces sp. CNQ-509]AKH82093.1 hypothetical protein AA958_07455 [Streptomyces sp. CNQ-509]
MQTDEHATDSGSGGSDESRRRRAETGRRGEPARPAESRDAYDDEQDEAIDADPQLREIGRARLRKRTDRASRGEQGGGARR